MFGKSLRLHRFFDINSKRSLVVPIDHGLTQGPIQGIEDYLNLVRKLKKSGVNGFILHKGILKTIAQYDDLAGANYICHLSASTNLSPDVGYKVQVAEVEEAIKLGADGVSIHVNLSHKKESEMIYDFGKIVKACNEWGMPLLAMMYSVKKNKDGKTIAHAARIAEELGADVVKIAMPNKVEDLKVIVKDLNIPVLVAGGEKVSSIKNLLLRIKKALKYNVSGFAIGRNIFQHNNPPLIANIIWKLLNEQISVESGLKVLNNKRNGSYIDN